MNRVRRKQEGLGVEDMKPIRHERLEDSYWVLPPTKYECRLRVGFTNVPGTAAGTEDTRIIVKGLLGYAMLLSSGDIPLAGCNRCLS